MLTATGYGVAIGVPSLINLILYYLYCTILYYKLCTVSDVLSTLYWSPSVAIG